MPLSPAGLIDDDVPPCPIQGLIEPEACLPLCTPILKTAPKHHRSSTLVTVRSLRRSGRIAAKPHAHNAMVQAQRLLLRKLGIPVEEYEVDADIECKFNCVFKGDMSVSKQQKLQILLRGGVDVSAMNLNLAGLDDEAL